MTRRQIGALYDRKQQLCWQYLYRARQCLGGFQACQKVTWEAMKRLVFVYDGNICRSACAEAKVRGMGLQANSFGLDADRSSRADGVAVSVAGARGADLSMQRSRNGERRLALMVRDRVVPPLRRSSIVLKPALFEGRGILLGKSQAVCGRREQTPTGRVNKQSEK